MVLGEGSAGLGEARGGAVHFPAEDFDERAALGLAVEAHANLPDLAFGAEEGAGVGERRAPLTCAGFGGEAADARLHVIIDLRDRGVHLMRARGRDALVFIIDARRGPERLLPAPRAVEWGGAVLRVDVADCLGDLDIALGRDLLLDELHGEERGEIFRSDRL